PRLSSVLRRTAAGDGPGFDLDAEILQRERVESQWKSQADARASAPFSWKAFSEKVPESEAQRAAAEQDKFRRYCRLAGQLAGGDDGAAFPNADRALFQAINAGPNAAGKAKRDLELVVGKVAKSDWDDAASLAKELHAWRRDRVRASQPHPPAAPLRTPEAPAPAAARGQRGRSLLFGSEISFNFDLDARAPEEPDDELDRAFPGVNGGGASGGFAFDSFESFVGISADGGGGGGGGGSGAAAASEQQRWRPGTGATVDDQASSSSLGGEAETKHPVRDVGSAAAGGGAVHAPIASGTASSGKAGAAGAAAAAETFDAGWLYSRCMQFHAQQGSRGLPPVD
ncbi:unnamed protein product, partial [Ectocarpus sp. 8 AP-2014]